MTARRIVLLVVVMLVIALGGGTILANAGSPGKNVPPGTMHIHGAGATFPAPLYQKWLAEYLNRRPEVLLTYDAVGSGEGTKQFMAGAVDFGASDAALSDTQIAEVARGVQLVPAVAGSIVVAYNLEGSGGDLKLTRKVYVDIFLGKITHWDDLRIKRINPDLNFPKSDIVLAVRQDGSGTTYAFTNHLSAIRDEWRDRGPGIGTLIQWPGNAWLRAAMRGWLGALS